AIRRLNRGLGRYRRTDDRVGKLGAQHPAALVGDVARLGVAVLTQDQLEALPVELAVRTLKRGIEPDPPRDLGVADAKSHRTATFIKKYLGYNLPRDPAIKAERARLFERDRPAQPATQLLEPLVIDAAELLDRDFGPSDLGERRPTEAAKNVADPPDRETDHQHGDHDEHDRLAEPVGRGLP